MRFTPMGRTLGWRPSLPDYRNYVLGVTFAPAALPSKVDLRQYCSPVRDQGQLGSCTAFAISGAYETMARKEGLGSFDVSELFVYFNERRDQGDIPDDTGASIAESAKTGAKDGFALETDWPYDTSVFTVTPPSAAYASAKNYKISQYLSVKQDLNAMKSALAAGYVIAVGFTVYTNFESPPTSTTGQVMAPSGSVLGGHANLLVGYDDALFGGSFISRNSWGSSFGDSGYVYFPYSYLTDPNLASDFWAVEAVASPAPVPPTPAPPVPGPTAKMVFAFQPQGGVLGSKLPDWSVALMRADGTLNTDDSLTRVMVAAQPGALNPRTLVASKGVVSVSGDTFYTHTGSFTYVASAQGLSPVTSLPFTVSPAPVPPTNNAMTWIDGKRYTVTAV